MIMGQGQSCIPPPSQKKSKEKEKKLKKKENCKTLSGKIRQTRLEVWLKWSSISIHSKREDLSSDSSTSSPSKNIQQISKIKANNPIL
jgi:hypothetical protein